MNVVLMKMLLFATLITSCNRLFLYIQSVSKHCLLHIKNGIMSNAYLLGTNVLSWSSFFSRSFFVKKR